MKNRFINVFILTFLLILSSCSSNIDYFENVDLTYQTELNDIDKFNDENIVQEIDNKKTFINYLNTYYSSNYTNPKRIEYYKINYDEDNKNLYPNMLIVDTTDINNYYFYGENLGVKAKYWCVRYENNFIYKSYITGREKISYSLKEGKEIVKEMYEDNLPERISKDWLSISNTFSKAIIYKDKYFKVIYKNYVNSKLSSFYSIYYNNLGFIIMYESYDANNEENLIVKFKSIYNFSY